MKNLTAKQADLMLFFVAFFWGTGFSVTKIALEVYTPVQLLFIRFILASVASVIIFYKSMKNVSKSDVKAGAIMGLFLAIGYVFQTVGLQGTTTGNSAFITSTSVIMVPFFNFVVTKLKPGKNNIVAAILMFLGIILLTVDFNNFGQFNIWDFLTFLSAVCFAWQIIATGMFAGDRNPIILSTIQIFTCTIIFFFLTMFEGEPIAMSAKGLTSMTYLALISTMLCFLMQTIGQKYTSTTHAAIILSTESVIGSIIGVLFLREAYSFFSIIGFIVIFIAILIAEVGIDWIYKQIKQE